jgi:hypothetical protein
MSTSNAEDFYDPGKKLDQYSYSEKFHWLQEKLWFCAGADVELMRRCPRSEQIKEEGIGGIVLATAVLAFFSGSYAMYVVFGPKVGLALSPEQEQIHWPSALMAGLVGLIWSMIILNIDRFVVSSTGHGDGTDKITWGEFGRALPRLSMAIIIGLCLSAPLEIRVMKTEIEAKLLEIQADYMKNLNGKEETEFKQDLAIQEQKKAAAEAKIRKLDEQFATKEKAVVGQRKELDREAQGRGANTKYGLGPAYQALEKSLNALVADLDSTRVATQEEKTQLKAEVKAADDALNQRRAARKEQMEENRRKAVHEDGLVKRIQVAHDIGGNTSIILMLLLMVIEVAPIFFKMMMPRGPYLSLLDNQAAIVLARNAITKDTALSAGTAGTTAEAHERYHRAETIQNFEVGQLESEQHLASVALEALRNQKADDIRASPGKYADEGREQNDPKA